MSTEQEIWKPIVGWENLYEVSNLGRVKQKRHQVIRRGRVLDWEEKILKSWLSDNKKRGIKGYLRVRFYDRKGGSEQKFVHVLVLETFISPRPPYMFACHNDGNRFNNRVENLRWDTKLNNARDKARHGTEQIGEDNPSAILTEAEVLEILWVYETGYIPRKKLSEIYGVSVWCIDGITRRNTWKHLEPIDYEKYLPKSDSQELYQRPIV